MADVAESDESPIDEVIESEDVLEDPGVAIIEERSRSRSRSRSRASGVKPSSEETSLVVCIKEKEALQIIGDQAQGLTELAEKITAKLRSLGYFIKDEIEIKVPVSSHDGYDRKMLFLNIPPNLEDLALAELLSMVSYCKLDKCQTILKDDLKTSRARSGELVTRTLTVSVDKVGLLIGRGGSRVKDIRQTLNVDVNISPEEQMIPAKDNAGGGLHPDSDPDELVPSCLVTIQGSSHEKVEHAYKILIELVGWATAHPRSEAGRKMEISLHHVPKLLRLADVFAEGGFGWNPSNPLYNQSKIKSDDAGAENLQLLEDLTGSEIEIDQSSGTLGYATLLVRGGEKEMTRAVELISREYLFRGDNAKLFYEMGAKWMVHDCVWKIEEEKAKANLPPGPMHGYPPPPFLAAQTAIHAANGPPGPGFKGGMASMSKGVVSPKGQTCVTHHGTYPHYPQHNPITQQNFQAPGPGTTFKGHHSILKGGIPIMMGHGGGGPGPLSKGGIPIMMGAGGPGPMRTFMKGQAPGPFPQVMPYPNKGFPQAMKGKVGF